MNKNEIKQTIFLSVSFVQRSLKKLTDVLYKVYIFIKQYFFLVQTPEWLPPQPSSSVEGGLGGFGLPQEGELMHSQPMHKTSFPFEEEGTCVEKGDKIPPSLKNQQISLCETIDRVLNTGVVVHGDITISVANIDLIYIGLSALITSVETARKQNNC